MFHFYSLYSGSSGNSLFVETSNTKILIDAGESAKKITEALSHLHVDVSDINAIFVTHEHTDHTKGLATLSKKYQIPVFACEKHWLLDKRESTLAGGNRENVQALWQKKAGGNNF